MFKTLRFYLVCLLVTLCGTAFADDAYYVLDTSNDNNRTSSSAYNGTGTVSVGGIEWVHGGNGQINPWRIGGKNITDTDRATYTQTPMDAAISSIDLTVGEASGITVNSLKLVVASDAQFKSITDEVSANFIASSTIQFYPTTGTSWAKDSYYKFVFNVTVSGNSNKFVQFSKVEFYKEVSNDSELMTTAKALAADKDAVAVGKLIDAIDYAETSGDESKLQAAIDQFKADNAGSELDVTSKVGTGTDKWVNAQNCDAGEFKVYNGNGVNLIQVFGVTGVGDVLTQEVEVENGIYNISLYATSHNAWNGQYGANTAGAPSLQEDADDVAYVFAKSGETTQQTWITARRNSGLVEIEPVAYSINGIEVADGKLTFGLALAQAAMTEWHSIQIKSLSKVTTAKAKFAAIKALLNDEITAAKALVGTEGLEAFNTAIGNAETALNDNHLNIAELEDAIETLKKAEKAFIWGQYTVENPSNDLLVNGSCDTNNTGWTLNNMQYQQNGERPTRYIEKWVGAGNNGHLPDVSTKQIFKDMPAGAYVLKGTANAQQQEHADWTITGASLYVNDATVAVSGTWKEYQIVYNHEAEGDIEVGFKTESTNANWVGIDELSLVYYGDYATYAIAAPKKNYQDALAEAQAALEAEKNVTGSEKTALEAEVAKAEPSTAEGYEAATNDLKAATKTFTDAAPNYNYLAAANAAIVDLPYANAEKKPEAKTADNATAAKQAGDELYAALRTYYESNAAAEGKAGATDATELITNAAANDGINGWTTTNGEGSTGSVKVLNNEPWVSADGIAAHNYFDGGDWNKNSWDVSFTQDVALEPGKYLLSAISRASADVDLKLFAGTDSVKTASIGAADGVFTRGWNIHNVRFKVTEAGAVTIGVRGVTSVLHNWMSFSDFRLVKLSNNDSDLMKAAKALAADEEAVAVGKLIDAIDYAETSGDESKLQAAIDQFKADNAGSELDVTSKVGTGTDKWVNAQNCDAGEFKVYNGNGVNLIQVFGVTGVGDVLTQEVEVENGIYNISLYATSHNAWNGQYGANTAGAPSLQEDADDVAYVFAKSGETTQQTWITARRNSGLVEIEPVAYSINGIEVADGKLTFGLALAQAAMTEWHSIQIKSLSKVTTAKAKFAAIKALLNDEITAAKALVGTEGLEAFNTAIGNAETALNDNHLNIAELEDAIETLKKAEKAFIWGQYTVENPSNDLLVNGSCDTNNTGWTLNNMQYQQNGERPTRYIEKWVGAGNNGHLPDVSTKQIFKDMPAGAYVLKGTANAQQQEHADWTITGASLYVNDATVAVSGTWKEYQIVYNHEAEGDIEVGFKTESTNANWVGIDELSLVYYGDYATYAIAAPKKNYQDALAEAQAALEAEKNVTGSEKTALEAEVAKAEPSTAEGYEAATNDLKAATKTFTDAAPNYNYLAAANAAIVDLPYANAEKKPEAKTADNATAAKQAGDELYAALRTYYESNAAAEGKAGATDATELITNAAANDGINGWTTTNGEGSTGSVKVLNNEPWVSADGIAAHNYFDGGDWNKNSWDVSFTQDVALEPGKYLLSAISRASADVDLKLFAGTDSVKTASIGAADGVFTRGWNIHNVRFKVTEAGAVTIGVRGVTSVLHNWMSFSDFRLVKLDKSEQGTTYDGYIAIATTIPANPGVAIQPVSTTTQNVTITEGAAENTVNISFSGFNLQMPPTAAIEDLTLVATATEANDGIAFSSEAQTVSIKIGQMTSTYKATIEGTQEAEGTPALLLNLSQSATTYIAFAGTEEAAKKLLNDTLAKIVADGIENVNANNENKTIFNLNGQKLNKVQKGLNIINGKKVLRK